MKLHLPTFERVAVTGIVIGGLGYAGMLLYRHRQTTAATAAAAAAYQGELGPEAIQAQAGTLPLALDTGSGGLLDTLGYSAVGYGSLAASILDSGQTVGSTPDASNDVINQLNPSGIPEINIQPVANTAPDAGT